MVSMDTHSGERRRRKRTVRWWLIGAGAVALALAAGGQWVMRGQGGAPTSAAALRSCQMEETRVSTDVVSPYARRLPSRDFVQGATLDLSDMDTGTVLHAELRRMRDEYHVNTINVYGLERRDERRRDQLFDALRELGMAIALRIEWYDQGTFAFQGQDAGEVLAAHRALLAYAAEAGHREQVAYVMVNMPVDDPVVQQRLGGVDSPRSQARQVAYATEVVAGVRDLVGASGIRVFLGLFYGWDNSYQVPSYRTAGPDGYVLTNYSYPGPRIAGASASAAELINEPRLRVAADRAIREAGSLPVIVEYGFHTLNYQNGNTPDQKAGLVADLTAKRRAVRATTDFYCDRYPSVIGTMYFGYNTYKSEGSPPRRLDFGLTGE
jgi:hypothetical protein